MVKTLDRSAQLALPYPPPSKQGWPWTTKLRALPDSLPNGSAWPRLTIVTPSYNQGQFLEATIRSVLLQGYPNLEFIIIDGGSADNSVEILEKYDAYLEYWVSEPDKGQSDAVNKGLSRSTGDYIGWLNSDDMYSPGAFQKVVQTFLQNPRVDVVHGNRILVDHLDRVLGWSSIPAFAPPKVSVPVYSETAFWTKEVMEQAGVLDINYHYSMDLEFFTRLFLKGTGDFLKLNSYLGYLRRHPQAKTCMDSPVGVRETDNLWQELFSQDYPHHIPVNKKKLLIDLIKNPILIAYPYLNNRIQRILSKT